MKIHVIQTGIVKVKSAFLRGSVAAGGMLNFFPQLFTDKEYIDLPINAWVIEHPEGIIVVDTGDVAATKSQFVTQSKYDIQPEQEIGPQLSKLGIQIADISKVVLTHLHGDHTGGLSYFPNTPMWISEGEHRFFHSRVGHTMHQLVTHLPEWFKPSPIVFQPERFGNFDHGFPLTKDGTVIAVPTPGHTAGHMSIVVIDRDVHYFIAGDVTYHEQALIQQQLEGPSFNARQHPATLKRVLDYTQQYPTVYLPSHDIASAQRLKDAQTVPNRAVFA